MPFDATDFAADAPLPLAAACRCRAAACCLFCCIFFFFAFYCHFAPLSIFFLLRFDHAAFVAAIHTFLLRRLARHPPLMLARDSICFATLFFDMPLLSPLSMRDAAAADTRAITMITPLIFRRCHFRLFTLFFSPLRLPLMMPPPAAAFDIFR